MELAPGTMLLHYRLVEKIGEGGMGVVWKAVDTKLDREVAIKILPDAFSQDPERLARFRQEARAVAALNHPSIVTIHSVEEADGVHFITMELVRGRPLSAIIPREGLSFAEFLAIAVPLVEALGAAHREGITHRDLKPDNIMVADDGSLRVLDFGLARLRREAPAADETTLSGQPVSRDDHLVGTMPYMSPEQLQGKDVDPRTDIFALGVIFYEMLGGRRPFQGATSVDLISSILKDTPRAVTDIRPGLPHRAGRLVARCLEKDPASRFQATNDLGVELERLKEEGEKELIPSIAVLPFENMSADPEQEYFCDGIAEEIINGLAHVAGLRVAARTSAFAFKGKRSDMREIGKKLDVDTLLEGSVRKAGDRVRITAQLIDASTGFRLWSEDLDGELTDVLVLQEEAALQIVEALDLRLSRQEASAVHLRHTEDPRAYDAYLRGWALLESFHSRVEVPKEGLDAAQEHFQRAIAFDRDYAPALAGLSWLDSYYHFFDIDRSPERLRRAERLARRALTLAPELPEAHAAMAELRAREERWAAAIDGYREALRLDPGNAIVWCHLAWVCNTKDPPDLEQAERSAREAVRLHPTYFWSYAVLGTALAMQERYEEAIASFEFALQLSPDYRDGHVYLGGFHRTLGDYDRALGHYEQAGAMGETPELVVLISSTHVGRGDTAKALAELERALAGGYRDFAAIEDSPYFKPLSRLPRFQALLARYRD